MPTGFAMNFKPSVGDSLRNLTISFPAGFLINLQTNGGVCLGSATPNPLCEIGSGTVNGPTGTAMRLYLVAPPAFADLAGVELVEEGGGTSTGGITLTGSPNVAMAWPSRTSPAGVPVGIGEMQFTLKAPRLPSGCTTTPLVKIQATSYLTPGSTGSASAPMSVTGCNSMTFAPAISATVAKQPKGTGAVVTIDYAQGAGDSAVSALQFGTPTGVKINKVLAPCFAGTTCTVGSIAISSPLLPGPALAGGALTLAGAINSASRSAPITGALTMAFPPPYQYFVEGPINLAEHTITFLGLPDIPITSMDLTFTGTTSGPAFVTNCEAGTITATATPQDGAAGGQAARHLDRLGLPAAGFTAGCERLAGRARLGQAEAASHRLASRQRYAADVAVGGPPGRAQLQEQGAHQLLPARPARLRAVGVGRGRQERARVRRQARGLLRRGRLARLADGGGAAVEREQDAAREGAPSSRRPCFVRA